ncbi:MAG: hypothetical protein LBV17_00015 [Treponema sp.]|jgi:hypothetical protein|nr:hypothetical protein [Treponema sp.]
MRQPTRTEGSQLSNKSNIKTNLFYRTDSVRNILSNQQPRNEGRGIKPLAYNKLSAIFRYAAKDVADIREIALYKTADWTTVINEARDKEAGLEFVYVSEILASIPHSEFETIAWTKKLLGKNFVATLTGLYVK